MEIGDSIKIIPSYQTVNDYMKWLDDHKKETREKIAVKEWVEMYTKQRGQQSAIILLDEQWHQIQNIIYI